MRFELVLSGLPDISIAEAKDKMAGLPKGVSTGIIIKAMQDGRLPSVAIAWSEDKRILNEIQDRITEMGGHSDIVDHGFFLFKIGTWAGEKMGFARYRKAEKEDRNYVKIGDKYKQKSVMSDATRRMIIVAMQMVAVEMMFVWRISLKVGASAMGSAPWLPELMIACGIGVVCAYMFAHAVDAFRAGRIGPLRAAPFILLSVGCTIASLFYIKEEQQAELARRSIGRPPSNPYAGLITELRKRLDKGELALAEGNLPGEGEGALFSSLDEFSEDEMGMRMCVDASDFDPSLRACMGGPDWELLCACLPQPKRPKPPKLIWPTVEKPKPVLVAKKVTKRKVVRASGLTLGPLELGEVTLLWMMTLGALYYFVSRRAKPLTAEADGTTASPAPTAALPARPANDAELGALRAQLAQAHTVAQQALAQIAQLQASGAPNVQALQEELAATQAELEAHRSAVAQFRQQLKPVREEHAAQVAEIARLRQMLLTQAATQINAQGGANTATRAAPPANNQGTFRRPAADDDAAFTDERSSSSYSVVAGQEERISRPKRRP